MEKLLPIGALIISFSSFMFSIFVLYPWHLELSRQFDSLEKYCENINGA